MDTFRTTRRSPREYLTARRTFCRPVTARSRPILAPAITASGVFLLVKHNGIINRHRFRTRQMPRHPTFDAGRHFVANTNIGERAAHHHFASLPRRDPQELNPSAQRRGFANINVRRDCPAVLPAGEIWSVVTESPSIAEDTRAVDIFDCGAGWAAFHQKKATGEYRLNPTASRRYRTIQPESFPILRSTSAYSLRNISR